MSDRIRWEQPLDELAGLTPAQWLEAKYPTAPDTKALAAEMATLLGTERNLTHCVKQQASVRGLKKTQEAMAEIARRRVRGWSAPARATVHIFEDWETSYWDRAVITSDWHIPYWNPNMAERMMLIAKNWKPEPIKNLNIGGDFVDFGQISVFQAEEEEIPRKVGDDLRHTQEILEWLLGWFEDVVILKANHEARLAKVLEKQIAWDQVQRLVSTMENFRWSNWSWCVIEDSLGNQWRVTHPGRRWKNLNRLAQELANRYQMNVVLAHSHVMSLGYNISGNYITIDSGGMCDPSAMGYYVKTDAPYWRWCPGFLVIDQGKVHMFNDVWTDWRAYEDWLGIDLGVDGEKEAG